MSLNKTRKRAIARARRRLEMPGQELLSGYTVEQISKAMQAVSRFLFATSAGIAAFVKAFSESMSRQ